MDVFISFAPPGLQASGVRNTFWAATYKAGDLATVPSYGYCFLSSLSLSLYLSLFALFPLSIVSKLNPIFRARSS